ncbi:hypothetical protein V8B97DRAFT_2015163, partial [Scleroderma yunnanense]
VLPNPCPLESGPYRITARYGPVGTAHVGNENRVVVSFSQIFHLEQVEFCVYRITAPGGGSVEDRDTNVVVLKGVAEPQLWFIESPYDRLRNFTIRQERTDLVWTDPGGLPGPEHQLHLTIYDPNYDQQRFSIERVPDDVWENICKRK